MLRWQRYPTRVNALQNSLVNLCTSFLHETTMIANQFYAECPIHLRQASWIYFLKSQLIPNFILIQQNLHKPVLMPCKLQFKRCLRVFLTFRQSFFLMIQAEMPWVARGISKYIDNLIKFVFINIISCKNVSLPLLIMFVKFYKKSCYKGGNTIQIRYICYPSAAFEHSENYL